MHSGMIGGMAMAVLLVFIASSECMYVRPSAVTPKHPSTTESGSDESNEHTMPPRRFPGVDDDIFGSDSITDMMHPMSSGSKWVTLPMVTPDVQPREFNFGEDHESSTHGSGLGIGIRGMPLEGRDDFESSTHGMVPRGMPIEFEDHESSTHGGMVPRGMPMQRDDLESSTPIDSISHPRSRSWDMDETETSTRYPSMNRPTPPGSNWWSSNNNNVVGIRGIINPPRPMSDSESTPSNLPQGRYSTTRGPM